jgi:hypothetical protein
MVIKSLSERDQVFSQGVKDGCVGKFQSKDFLEFFFFKDCCVGKFKITGF